MSEHAGYLRFMRDMGPLSRRANFGFVGDESFFKQDAYLSLIAHWRKTMPIDEERYDGNEGVKISTLHDAIAEYPLLGRFRIILVENADKVKDLKQLNSWFEDPPLDAKILVSYSDEVTEIPKDMAFACAVVCNDMGPQSKEYDKYLGYCLESTGKRLSQQAIEFTRQVFGEHVWRIRSELKKVSYYIGEREEIQVDDLQKALSVQHIARIFDLVDLVIKRELHSCLVLLDDLMNHGMEPGGFFTLLVRRLTILENVNKAYARGEKLKDYMMRKKIPLFQFDALLEGTRYLKPYHFQKWYVTLCEAEAELRFWAEPRHVLEKLLVRLCS
jgi:DNA polymerase-3 subunit delta